ncbi:MAG: hypothetical protein ACRDZX_18210 [Acidimicrobiales bacterium]
MGGGDLVLRLSGVDKAEGIHGDLRFPSAAVDSAEVIDEPLKAVQGSGLGFLGVVAVGTFHGAGTKTFAVVHHGTRRGVGVRLHDASSTSSSSGAMTLAGPLRSFWPGRTDSARRHARLHW